jgi:hypothetical protein
MQSAPARLLPKTRCVARPPAQGHRVQDLARRPEPVSTTNAVPPPPAFCELKREGGHHCRFGTYRQIYRRRGYFSDNLHPLEREQASRPISKLQEEAHDNARCEGSARLTPQRVITPERSHYEKRERPLAGRKPQQRTNHHPTCEISPYETSAATAVPIAKPRRLRTI